MDQAKAGSRGRKVKRAAPAERALQVKVDRVTAPDPRPRASLSPKARPAAAPVAAAPVPALPAAAATRATVWFDYTDLIHYFEDNRVPTGIQRVQIGIFRASLERTPGAGADRVAACSFDPERRCWVPVPEALLASVCRAACHTGAMPPPGVRPQAIAAGDQDSWHALIQALRHAISTGAAAPFAAGDLLVNIGTSWWIPDYMRYVEHLQRERGVLYAPFLHDCIPLRVPEMCSAGLVGEFRDWFAEAMRVADLVLANSTHTGKDVAEYARALAGQPVDPLVVRLDARFDDGPQPGQAAASRLDALTHAKLSISRPFALFVATVEARKNHVFVFECWKVLIERHGDAVPDLICVGKLGWLVDYTLNWLQVHPHLAGRVRLAGTISDLDLSALYRTAAFTVYCSHYEGWGLPVTESLCHGRVPVVPRHSSLPEAGGAFALYYEPGSQPEFCAAVERLMDPRERAEGEARIRARFRPRAWSDVLAQIVDTVRSAPVRPRSAVPAMRAGAVYVMNRRPASSPDPASVLASAVPGHALKHGIGWHTAEDWGTWSRQGQAHLLLRLPGEQAVDLLYLVLRGGPADQYVSIQAGGTTAVSTMLHAGKRKLTRVALDCGTAGRDLMVTFTAAPYSLAPFTGGGDPREVGFGLEALAITDRRDAVARLDLLECLIAAA